MLFPILFRAGWVVGLGGVADGFGFGCVMAMKDDGLEGSGLLTI
jgi:hypothetical protein